MSFIKHCTFQPLLQMVARVVCQISKSSCEHVVIKFLQNWPNFPWILFFAITFYKTSMGCRQLNPFLRVPRVTTQDNALLRHFVTGMFILSNQVWVLGYNLHLTQTLSMNLMAWWWVFKSQFFSSVKIHRNLLFHQNKKCLHFFTQCHSKIHLG